MFFILFVSSPTDISSNYLWLDRTFVDFKTILNLIYHLDALFTEELCTPGLWANGKSAAVVRGGEEKKKKKGTALTRQRELIISSSMLVHGAPLMGARGEFGADRWGCTLHFTRKTIVQE